MNEEHRDGEDATRHDLTSDDSVSDLTIIEDDVTSHRSELIDDDATIYDPKIAHKRADQTPPQPLDSPTSGEQFWSPQPFQTTDEDMSDQRVIPRRAAVEDMGRAAVGAVPLADPTKAHLPARRSAAMLAVIASIALLLAIGLAFAIGVWWASRG